LNLIEVNETIQFYIKPQTFPVAVRMCESGEDLPAKTKRPKRDLGSTIAVCQGISLARRYGWTIAIGQENESCPHGLFVLGYVPGRSYIDGSSSQAAGVGPKTDRLDIEREMI